MFVQVSNAGQTHLPSAVGRWLLNVYVCSADSQTHTHSYIRTNMQVERMSATCARSQRVYAGHQWRFPLGLSSITFTVRVCVRVSECICSSVSCGCGVVVNVHVRPLYAMECSRTQFKLNTLRRSRRRRRRRFISYSDADGTQVCVDYARTPMCNSGTTR